MQKKVSYFFVATRKDGKGVQNLRVGKRPPAKGTFVMKGVEYFAPPAHEVEVRFFLK